MHEKDAIPQWVLDTLPDPNARRVLSPGQKRWMIGSLLLLGLCLWFRPSLTFFVVNVGCIVFYLVFSHYRLFLQFLSVSVRMPAEPLRERREWPTYTVMVPLYRERTAVPGLVDHLSRMEYPADKLQVLLLAEEDDPETRAALTECRLPANFEVVAVPPSQPRTKPKACNYGLARARGTYVVIYDAEDRPERDQLRKAVDAFDRLPDSVVCLQAQLNYYNRDRNLLTRLFTTEYSTWFDFCLPGLFLLDAPIPLGGTSNHFRTAALRTLRGWDPFNVTEDCDLGIRLYMVGLRTACLDSTTWEEATFRLLPWIRQRSRWIKGYLQTYLVHLRHHGDLFRRMGFARTVHFHFLFGATVFCLLLNPVYWSLTVAWLATRSAAISSLYPVGILVPAMLCLLAGNAAFVLSSMLACLSRRNYHLVPHCLLSPLYWLFMSVGAWKGALQLVWKPHFWEKTPHDARYRMQPTP